MMNLVSTLNTITEVQNVEKHQVKETTGNVSSKSITSDKSTSLNNNTSDKTSNNTNDNTVNNKFNNVLSQIKSSNSKTDIVKNTKTEIKRAESKTTTKDSSDKKLEAIEEELDEKIENLTDDQLLQCLDLIAQLLNNNLQANENLNLQNLNLQNLTDDQLKDLTDSLKTSLMDILNASDAVNTLISNNMTAEDLMQNASDIFNKMLQALEKTDAKVEPDTLKLAQKLVSELSERINSNPTVEAKDNSNLTELIASAENKINELLDNSVKSNDEITLQNNSLNNIYKNVLDESNNSSSNNTNEDSDKQGYESTQSKDEKVLESILSDKSNTNAVPVFTTNTIVNNAAGTVVEVKQAVNVGTMAADIIQDVKYMASNDMREMVVKVNPGNLGQITIRLVEEEGMMKLHMKVTSKETYSLLVQQSSDIKNQLSDQNIKIQDVNISLYEEDTTFFKDGEFNNSFNEDRKGHNGNKTTSKNDETFNEEENEDENLYDTSSVNMLA